MGGITDTLKGLLLSLYDKSHRHQTTGPATSISRFLYNPSTSWELQDQLLLTYEVINQSKSQITRDYGVIEQNSQNIKNEKKLQTKFE